MQVNPYYKVKSIPQITIAVLWKHIGFDGQIMIGRDTNGILELELDSPNQQQYIKYLQLRIRHVRYESNVSKIHISFKNTVYLGALEDFPETYQ